MVGMIRPLALSLVVSIAALSERPARARDDAPVRSDMEGTTDYLGGMPQPFVPLHPRSVEDQKRVEAVKDYAAARALEDRRMLPEAIDLLEQALKKEPDSVAVLRQLSRLSFFVRKPDAAIGYSRRVIEADPNDSATLFQLVRYHQRRNDSDSVEAVLKSVLGNPKLEKTSPAYLLAQHELGMLYYRDKLATMDRSDPAYAKYLDKAADAFASLLDALDDKEASRLAFSDEQRIMGNEAESYLTFGVVLQEAKRYDLAVKAFQRGLVYARENPILTPQLTVQLAQALLAGGKNEEALAVAERFIKEQPQQRMGYDLLTRSLVALKREGEVIPRLEALAKTEPKNRAIQYALAERYNQTGQRDKASALYEELKNNPPSAQDFAALSAWLLQEKKTEDLIRLLGEAVIRPNGFEAVKPQIDAISRDREYAGKMLETGLKMMTEDPPTLSSPARRVLAQVAGDTKNLDKLLPILRLAVKKDPNPHDDYLELATSLAKLDKYAEAAEVLEQILAKEPNQRNARLLLQLGLFRTQAGKTDAAVEAFREAHKLEPNDPEVLRGVSFGLNKAGKSDEALEIARGVLKVDPSSPPFNSIVGQCLIDAGKQDEAITHFKGLLERFPGNDDLVKLARQMLSTIYVNMEDFAKGEAELEILLTKDPDDAGVNNDLGYLWADQGKNLDKAETMIRKAVAEDPSNYAYLDSLGWVLYKRGKAKEAFGQLERAAADEEGRKDATIFDHLGDVCFRLGENAKAKAAWEQAIKLASEAHPPDKRLSELRKKLESLKELDPAPKRSSGDNP
ncbi:MAG TPA: tetratricopeptide repeat protein [Isosphaeraceae bacterium]|nr:tetratricopeptide repeat protein [Isosphaeraceae bacterium]